MTKRSFVLLTLLILITACGSANNASRETFEMSHDVVSEVVERAPEMQNIQFSPNPMLPPYGVKATAEEAVLELQIHSSAKKAEDRYNAIQFAIGEITDLASENNAIAIDRIAANQMNELYPREEISNPNIPSLDLSSVTLKLTYAFSRHDDDLWKSIVVFNLFLNALDLPDTINIQVLSVATELGDLEAIREQLIAQVYRELDAIKQEYDSTVKFEVTGLHTPLKQIKLSDTEYYLYLEPVITVTEF